MENKLLGNIVKEYVALRARIFSYLIDDSSEDNKGTKKCAINRKIKFEDYKSSLQKYQLENKINHLQMMNSGRVINNS